MNDANLPDVAPADAEQEPDPRPIVLLTASEVGAMLKISARAVYKLAARHRWGFARHINARVVRYERRGLLQWIKRRP